MALLATAGTKLVPFRDQPGDRTPKRMTTLQTMSSVDADTGTVSLIGSATASNEYIVHSVIGTVKAVTAAATIDLLLAGDTIATMPPTVGNFSFNFGSIGLRGGTTTTLTVGIRVEGGTATVHAVCVASLLS